jgi:hypothetical protein
VQPGEISLGSWFVGLVASSSAAAGNAAGRPNQPVAGTLTVTDLRLLFKPKLAGATALSLLMSQFNKDQYAIILRRDQIANVQSDKGAVDTHVIVTMLDGARHVFGRRVMGADDIITALQQARQ